MKLRYSKKIQKLVDCCFEEVGEAEDIFYDEFAIECGYFDGGGLDWVCALKMVRDNDIVYYVMGDEETECWLFRGDEKTLCTKLRHILSESKRQTEEEEEEE